MGEVTGYISQPYGGTRLGVVDPDDPFGTVAWVHPARLTEDLRGTAIRCTCANRFPTLGTERSGHLAFCPLSLACLEGDSK